MRQEVRAFVAASDAGERSQLESSVAPEPAFRQFSEVVGYGRHGAFFRTMNRRALIEFLVRRGSLGDGTKLQAVRIGDFDREFDICNVSFVLLRRVGDGPWRHFGGKGATDAESGGIAVWNVGPASSASEARAALGRG